MVTRSLTRVNNGRIKIINMYRQFDGYPTGHGKELFYFLNGVDKRRIANGAGDLAAQLVMHFKQDRKVGGIYLEPVTAKDCGQAYEYIVTVASDRTLMITVLDSSAQQVLFRGTVADFGKFCGIDDH